MVGSGTKASGLLWEHLLQGSLDGRGEDLSPFLSSVLYICEVGRMSPLVMGGMQMT